MDLFWKNNGWEIEDRHLSALTRSPFKRGFPEIEIGAGVNLIRGPRQIGKSTWMKLLLSQATKLGKKCFYLSCEELQDYKDLAEVIRSQAGTTYFFLDEVTFVKEWWRTIKKAVDSNDKLHFILTGSNSYDLKKGVDLMPGRWSKSLGEYHLLPMLFDEWIAMRKVAGWKDLDTIEALKLYMRVGGFPIALSESGNEGKRPENAIEIYQRWLIGDTIKLNKQELFMKELLWHIAKNTCSSMSLHTLASKTQIMSYHTVQEYISILEHCFALRTIYAYDPEKDAFHYKKEKKFYFTDPIIYWVALSLVGQRASEDCESQLAEIIAAEFLSRKYKRLGYYSTRNGEVDFISTREIAIEVKWQEIVKNVSKAYKELKIANKRIWSYETFFEI